MRYRLAIGAAVAAVLIGPVGAFAQIPGVGSLPEGGILEGLASDPGQGDGVGAHLDEEQRQARSGAEQAGRHAAPEGDVPDERAREAAGRCGQAAQARERPERHAEAGGGPQVLHEVTRVRRPRRGIGAPRRAGAAKERMPSRPGSLGLRRPVDGAARGDAGEIGWLQGIGLMAPRVDGCRVEAEGRDHGRDGRSSRSRCGAPGRRRLRVGIAPTRRSAVSRSSSLDRARSAGSRGVGDGAGARGRGARRDRATRRPWRGRGRARPRRRPGSRRSAGPARRGPGSAARARRRGSRAPPDHAVGDVEGDRLERRRGVDARRSSPWRCRPRCRGWARRGSGPRRRSPTSPGPCPCAPCP